MKILTTAHLSAGLVAEEFVAREMVFADWRLQDEIRFDRVFGRMLVEAERTAAQNKTAHQR
jgi:hypothetical protein